ncbi:hypothetical protein LIER_30114 [Lithospermum erythrorhizon]|uniref:Reverse transcriptase n=1 Tax=Lithospermum erythrorhizon TaxID=34254 RepID=A0AAV3RPL9_LITER
MKKLKSRLKEINCREYSNTSTRVIEKHHELVAIQTDLLNGDLDMAMLKKARQLEKEYADFFSTKWKLFKSKSRVMWAKDGGSSAKYFHSCMRTHHVKNRITIIEDGDGNVIRDSEKIKSVVVEFYKDLFIEHRKVDMQLPSEAKLQTINDQDMSVLTAFITVEEIEDVVKCMKKGKAPGVDDYPIEFYRDTWEITKESVFKAVKTCFYTSNMPKYFNNTSLCIIPKVKKSSKHETI